MSDTPVPVGRFVWHDLMTTDVPQALSYYRDLLGWEYKEVDMGEPFGRYSMIHVGGTEHGGFTPLDAAAGHPPHWISYVAVEDVDATCAQAQELGGQVYVPGMDIPGTGRFAVIASATGAAISPYTPLDSKGDPTDPEVPFCWHELLSADPEGDGAFFSTLFGWKQTAQEIPGMGTYHLFLRGEDRQTAGMLKNPEEGARSAWLPYVAVEDVDATAAKVPELGGTVCVPPADIPGIGRFAVTADPAGAMLALFKPAMAESAAPAEGVEGAA
jgi:uncharacterized protein